MEGLASIGIEPGWITVERGEKSFKCFMTDEGRFYPEYQTEASRQSLNTTNWFKTPIGYTGDPWEPVYCTKDSVFIFDGIEYRLDDNGRLNLPPGTPVLPFNEKQSQIII